MIDTEIFTWKVDFCNFSLIWLVKKVLQVFACQSFGVENSYSWLTHLCIQFHRKVIKGRVLNIGTSCTFTYAKCRKISLPNGVFMWYIFRTNFVPRKHDVHFEQFKNYYTFYRNQARYCVLDGMMVVVQA